VCGLWCCAFRVTAGGRFFEADDIGLISHYLDIGLRWAYDIE